MRAGTITVNPDSPDRYSVTLEEGELLEIGRKPPKGLKRKLVLPFPEVSGQHAEIRCKTDGWTIVDSGSTNGTMVNGTRLTSGREYKLRNGDRISIAQYDLLVAPPPTLDNNVASERDSQEQTQLRIHLINATILVGDIKRFTSLMERYATNPELVMQAARHVFQIVSDEIQKNYGQLEKIAGDAIMAYWPGDESGASVPAYQACLTALKVRLLVNTFRANPSYWPFPEFPLALDLALATGAVAAGALGAASQNPALLGDTANLVFRLEKLIEDDRKGDIVVESMTYELTKDYFEFESLGEFSIKGRQRPVGVYRLLGLKQ